MPVSLLSGGGGVAFIKIDKSLTYRGDNSRCIYKKSPKFFRGKNPLQYLFSRYIISEEQRLMMYDEITYHIYAQDRCLYANLKQDEFDETWEMLKVMVGLLKTDYTERDLSYIKLGPKCGVGGPGRVIPTPMWEEDSY